jgi:uncharacterized membrane protein YqhA
MCHTIIHCVFILSAIGISYTDKLKSAAAAAAQARPGAAH